MASRSLGYCVNSALKEIGDSAASGDEVMIVVQARCD